ncbi:MAG: aminotransferase class III-fold pyridoxal phosphate-dependent enzyme, partial [Silvanigrellaceae bacterium]|nr:aminotransferase class III-fold pyridoxal phosphate-dependent enzyme [Silvanigrellaceae bacterium]
TGFWRLGKISAAHYLGVLPDIACYGKQLTGGLLPLSVTLASEEIFHGFLSDKLSKALLHGHSFTAHPQGCCVANEAIDFYQNSPLLNKATNTLFEMWPQEVVNKISDLKTVAKVVCLGTLLSIEIKDEQPGYLSMASQDIIKQLNSDGFFVRPLGNTIYFLANFSSDTKKLREYSLKIYSLLNDFFK